jgi:parallel beta-helix repeat protein
MTLAHARDAIRQVKAKGSLEQPVVVLVRRGKYFLEETFLLDRRDSGTRECPILYKAYPDEKPVLSGGRELSGWRPYRGQIIQSALPSAKGGKWKFRQLFFNGQRQRRARWPKFDDENPLYGGWLQMEGPAKLISFPGSWRGDRVQKSGSGVAFKFAPGALRHHWSKPEQGEVMYFAYEDGWVSTVPVKSVDYTSRIITLTHGGYQFDVPPWYEPVSFRPGYRFRVENMLEDLDQPGEWCLDWDEGIVYFWPPSGSITDGDEVVVPALDCLVDLYGASWITISGFTFTETMDGDNFHRDGVEGVGAMFPRAGWQYCGEAVHLKHAEHCVIENNHFSAVGGNGVYLEGHNLRNTIRCNEISEAGANGVCLAGTALQQPLFNRVSDNYIHHCGVLSKNVAGVFTGASNGNTIAHNHIEHIPHHGINLANTPLGRNIVEYNLIHHVGLETHDNGAINCWMEQPGQPDAQRCGHIIRYNYISDVHRYDELGKSASHRGIYLDNYTSNCLVYGNVIVRCPEGIMVHGGKNNLIENNVIVDCPIGVHLGNYVCTWEYWKPMASFLSANHILRNVIYQSDPSAFVFALHGGTGIEVAQSVAQSDWNLFFQGQQGKYTFQDATELAGAEKITSLSGWRALGFDENSVIADPLFVDAKHGDYRLRPDSPALKLGFVGVDLSKIGPRRHRTAM